MVIKKRNIKILLLAIILNTLLGCSIPENYKFEDYRNKKAHTMAEFTMDNRACIITVEVFEKVNYHDLSDIIKEGKYIIRSNIWNYDEVDDGENPMRRALYIKKEKVNNLSKLSKEKPVLILDHRNIEHIISVEKGDWLYFIPLTKNEVGSFTLELIK